MTLMAKLVFVPVADRIDSGTYLVYDGACGTGGMLTVAEKTLQELARAHGKQVAAHLYGQEINSETYARRTSSSRGREKPPTTSSGGRRHCHVKCSNLDLVISV